MAVMKHALLNERLVFGSRSLMAQWYKKAPFHWLAQNLMHQKFETRLLTNSKTFLHLYQIGVGSQ